MGYSKLFGIFFLFFIFTAFAPTASLNTSHKCSSKQSEALLLFKHNHFPSINYRNDHCYDELASYYRPTMMSWNTSIDCCNWDGVFCDLRTGDVISLYLSCGMLQGTIHPDSSLFNLTHLTFLDLSGNNLYGLPHYIFNLHSLETLYLDANYFTGDFPSEISVNLTHLTSLDLSFNKLNGTLPSWLFTFPSLEVLDLSYNMFSGNVPFESFTLPSLKRLYLSSNQLAGQIDAQAFRQLTNLTDLSLSYNNFSGELELDTLLSSLTNLLSLDLSYSGFSVTTNNTNHYVNPGFRYLYLASCKLKVFPNSLRAMKQLRSLDLSSNEIHGQIPHWAGEIGLDYLNLQSNLIEGPFPPSICNMSKLQFLDMSNNRFGGSIPQCFGNISSYLVMIDMGNNSFQGTIPNIYGDCGYLEGIILKGNQLEGELPSSLSNCQALKVLDLGNNHLNGTFPGWLGALRNLEGIILKGNQLEGELPSSLSKCQSLKVVDFGKNHLNGTFPGWLGALLILQVLVLKSNNFHGHIQTSATVYSPFPSLRVLDLSHNGFVGQLPAKYFQNFNSMKNVVKSNTTPEYLSTIYNDYYSFVFTVKGVKQVFPKLFVSLTIIDLSNNYFDRGIPEIIGNLRSLKVLDLSHNSLNGRIPDSLGKLSEIESLDLSCNQLTGNIPQSLTDLTFLEFLNLSKNHLEGSIPQGNQLRTFEENSYSENPKLCGFPLLRKCNEYLHEVQLEADEDEEESGFTWKMVMLGYGCGTIIGLVIGYLMLSSTRPNWLSAIADAGEHMILKRQNKRRSVYMRK